MKEVLKKFDEEGLGELEWCGNEDHECQCSVKTTDIKLFILTQHKEYLEGEISWHEERIEIIKGVFDKQMEERVHRIHEHQVKIFHLKQQLKETESLIDNNK